MGREDHIAASKDTPVRCAVLTVSDTRTAETDRSGRYIRGALEEHELPEAGYRIVPDEPALIRSAVESMLDESEVILIHGGTGISTRDTTFEVVQSMFDKSLPGFGEIFRMLSFEEIGPASMLSRASAGVIRGRLVFSMPGSTGAVRLAMERLILPEIRHLVWELVRQPAARTR